MSDQVHEEQVPGKGMSFSYFLSTIQGGDFHAELTKALHEMGAALNQHFQDYRGEPKGSMDIKLKFKLEKGVAKVTAEFSAKAPKPPEFGSLMFIDGANNFVQDDPRQLNMGFPRNGVRAVP